MFDPTAYENIKTVVEGYIYDKDLEGNLEILDRNDLFNSSKLSKEYTITVALKQQENAKISLSLLADIKNLAAELIDDYGKDISIGATIKLHLYMRHANRNDICRTIDSLLKELWGNEVSIVQEISYNPLLSDNIVTNHTIINFNRLITEEQLDDLLTMIDFVEFTLEKLSSMSSLLRLKGDG